MATQNKKFTKILLAGLFVGGAVAFGYACGGDDTAPTDTVVPHPDAGNTGTGGDNTTGSGGGGASGVGGDNAGGGGANAGGGGATGTGGGDAGIIPCQASGSFDNVKAKTVFPADGGVPAL